MFGIVAANLSKSTYLCYYQNDYDDIGIGLVSTLTAGLQGILQTKDNTDEPAVAAARPCHNRADILYDCGLAERQMVNKQYR